LSCWIGGAAATSMVLTDCRKGSSPRMRSRPHSVAGTVTQSPAYAIPSRNSR
jgi:hypothetical protein